MLAIAAERQSEKVALLRVSAQSRIGELANGVRLQVQNGNPLPLIQFSRAVAVLENCGVFAVRTNHDVRRQAANCGGSPGAGAINFLLLGRLIVFFCWAASVQLNARSTNHR